MVINRITEYFCPRSPVNSLPIANQLLRGNASLVAYQAIIRAVKAKRGPWLLSPVDVV